MCIRDSTYGGWVNRDLIGFYERYVRVLFNRYGHRVKYWLTFNEINSVIHAPFMSGGIPTPLEELTKSDLYQAVHHELVASALATKIGHETNPRLQVGCMVLALPLIHLSIGGGIAAAGGSVAKVFVIPGLITVSAAVHVGHSGVEDAGPVIAMAIGPEHDVVVENFDDLHLLLLPASRVPEESAADQTRPVSADHLGVPRERLLAVSRQRPTSVVVPVDIDEAVSLRQLSRARACLLYTSRCV